MINYPTKKLGEVLEISYGKGLPKDRRVDSGKYFAYGSNGPVYGTDKSLTKSETIVIGRKGTAGALYFISDPCWPIDTTFFVKPKSDVSLKFIYYLLQTKRLPRLAIVTGVPGINRTTLANVNVQLPPLAIQKQIVERLDKIAEAQKLNDGLIQKTDELFQSLLHSLIHANRGVVKKLGDIAEILGGFAFKSNDLMNKKVSENYLPVIKIGNVLKSGDLDVVNVQYHKFYSSLEKYLINFADILVAMTGATVGKVVSSKTNNLLLNQRVGLIRSKPELVNQHFLGTVLETKQFYKYCQKTAGGGAQGNISPTQIMLYETVLPPLETQKQIVAKLSAVQNYKKQLLEQKSKLKELFDSALSRSMKEK